MWSWALFFQEKLGCIHISLKQVHPGIITIQGMLRKIDCLRLPLASRRDVESILVRQVCREIDRALPWQAGHGRRTAAISLLIGQAVGHDDGRVARSQTRCISSRHRALDASSRPHHRRKQVRSRILRHRTESSSAWRLATRTVLLSPRGYRSHSPSSRTMGRIWLSVRHQRAIHPPWIQDPLDRRRLRCHPRPRSLRPSCPKHDRTQNYPSCSRHPI